MGDNIKGHAKTKVTATASLTFSIQPVIPAWVTAMLAGYNLSVVDPCWLFLTTFFYLDMAFVWTHSIIFPVKMYRCKTSSYLLTLWLMSFSRSLLVILCWVFETFSMSLQCWLREFLVGSGWAGQTRKQPDQDTPISPPLGIPFCPALPPRMTSLLLFPWPLCYLKAGAQRRRNEKRGGMRLPAQQTAEYGSVRSQHLARTLASLNKRKK